MGGGSVRIVLASTETKTTVRELSRFHTPYFTNSMNTYWDLKLILTELERILTTISQDEDINTLRSDFSNQDVRILDELMEDANTGNNLIVNDPQSLQLVILKLASNLIGLLSIAT